MTQFRYPVIGVSLYLLLIHYLQPPKESTTHTEKDKKNSKTKKFGATEKFMFFHNMLLCIFSLLCFWYTAPIMYDLFERYSWRDVACYEISKQYDGTFGFWANLFYLSKYYEFIDTLIVIAKGRRPITLQVFHHCGAVFGMWALNVTRSSAGYLFVVENSFIHTIMYFYYALSLLGVERKSKFILTIMQMIQFVIGISLAAYQIYTFGDCLRTEDICVILMNMVYTITLFIMFAKFYRSTYVKPKEKKI